MDWLIPPGVSTFAGDIDWLYYLILIICGIAFVIVEVGLIWFLVKYRGRPGRKAVYSHGNIKAEIIWTAIPAVTVIAIGILSAPVWNQIKGRDSIPRGALPVEVNVKQFEWNFTYPGADGQLGTADDFTIRNKLHIPVDTPIVVLLKAEDVIHSFFVPAFRIKQDAVPGMLIRAWFQATTPGTYELACAELCGLGHYKMRAVVTVYTQEDYRRWLATPPEPVAIK